MNENDVLFSFPYNWFNQNVVLISLMLELSVLLSRPRRPFKETAVSYQHLVAPCAVLTKCPGIFRRKRRGSFNFFIEEIRKKLGLCVVIF